MTVKIEIYGADAKEAREEMRRLLGNDQMTVNWKQVDIDEAALKILKEGAENAETTGLSEDKIRADEEAAASREALAKKAEDDTPAASNARPDKRPLGAPSAGKSRRNSAEKTEDDDLEALAVAKGIAVAQLGDAIAQVGRAEVLAQLKARPDAGDEPQISSGENRTGPEDDPETEAQDKADEQAEVEANREPDSPPTMDDLRAAMSKYVEKFDMAAAQEDGPKIFQDALGKPPADEAGWKMSLVAAQGEEHLSKAIAAWEAASEVGKRYGAK